MRIDQTLDQAKPDPRRRAIRRTPWLRLLTALLDLGQNRGELLRHSERGWASVTFTGTRHTAVLAFTGPEAIAAGEALIGSLPDHEFAIPGQLVADAAVVAVRHTVLPQRRLEVEMAILLLDDVQ